VVVTAKAFGLQAVDMVHIDYKDVEGLRRQAREGALMGFTGAPRLPPDPLTTPAVESPQRGCPISAVAPRGSRRSLFSRLPRVLHSALWHPNRPPSPSCCIQAIRHVGVHSVLPLSCRLALPVFRVG